MSFEEQIHNKAGFRPTCGLTGRCGEAILWRGFTKGRRHYDPIRSWFFSVFLLATPAKASIGVDMVKETLDFGFDTPESDPNEFLKKFTSALENKDLSNEDRSYIHVARSYVYYYLDDSNNEIVDIEKAIDFNKNSYLAYVFCLITGSFQEITKGQPMPPKKRRSLFLSRRLV